MIYLKSQFNNTREIRLFLLPNNSFVDDLYMALARPFDPPSRS